MDREPGGGRTGQHAEAGVGVGDAIGTEPGLLLDNLALGVGVAVGAGVGGPFSARREGDDG